MEKLRSKTFKRMFLSYVTMIVLCFMTYSVVVIHEAVVLKREQAEQYYELKGRDVIQMMDGQVMTARKILANVNGMTILNQLYRSIQSNETVDSYVLYQLMQEIRQQKTGTGAGLAEISSVTCLLDHYDRAYTSEDVIRLEKAFELPELSTPFLFSGSLNELTGLQCAHLNFSKEYLIYGDVYRYRSGAKRGLVCVLFDLGQIENKMDSYLGEGEGYRLFYDGQEIFSGGVEETSHLTRAVSSMDPRISVEIFGAPRRFHLELDAVLSVAMGAGIIASILFLFLAFFYSNRFYAPISRIWQMIGLEKEEEDGFSELAAGVESLMGERDGYRNEILTISPYAKTGMIHSLLSGEAEDGQLYQKDILSLENMFFIVAVINLFCEEKDGTGKERMKRCRDQIRAYVQELSSRPGEKNRYICFERDRTNLYLVINTDHGEGAEELVYEVYQGLWKRMKDPLVSITMGVDEVKEQIGDLPASCQNAMTALNRILLEGRGCVYFYEENDSSNNYYFPREVTRQLAEEMSQGNLDKLTEFLEDLKQKNMMDLDVSNRGLELLLDDLYVSTVKAVRRVNRSFGLGIHVEKLPPYLTFEEVEEYYRHVYEIVIEEVEKNRPKEMEPGKHDQEIFQYVDENFSDPDISLAAIGERFAVSTKYITSLFKQRVGITYLQYVQERRIAQAVHQLRHTEESLEEIAKKSGYTNMLTFRRNFKAIMGMNPSDFERQTL